MRRFARRHISIMMVAFICLALLSTSVGQAGPANQGPGPAAIHLRAATFTPALGQAPTLPPGLAISGYAPGQRGYYIVQFLGPIEQTWKDVVAAEGADLLEYIPDFAFKVRMNPGQAQRVEQLGGVAWVGLFHPAYKLDPTMNRAGARLYRVRVERGADVGQTMAAVARLGLATLRAADTELLITADSAQLDTVANVLDVAWIEPLTLRQKHNETGAGVIMGANIANASGYDGSTQIAAVADTGLGDGTAAGAHADIPASRIVAIYNWPGSAGGCFSSILDDGSVDVDSGHGSHVAGSVLSDGGAGGLGKGVAPAARLVFQSTENWANISGICKALYGYTDGYYLTGLPSDIRTLFQQAYNAGARIHSNSWGSDVKGDYTLDSANTDSFVWTNKDMIITFSAGNDGIDANNDGIVDNDSMGSPATAKNVLSVGASENDRRDGSNNPSYPCDSSLTYTSRDAYQTGQTCSSMGFNNWGFLGTWGSRYPDRFAANPIKDDVTAGNKEQIAGWSSRGPTDDNRIKPDVVAPGTWILSGYSGLYQEGYGDPVNPRNGIHQWDGYGMPYNADYKYMGGTSMSNPLAAGAATVVRDFYQKVHSLNATAALVKATLINSAVDLLDENNDGANDNDYPIPNNHEGWGRVNVANATDGLHKFTENITGVTTSSVTTYQAGVTTVGALKVTLVWTDYASTETATINLVNDLDLEVQSPGGTLYRGNVFSGGWSATGGSADRRNNVENVYVSSAAVGTWTITVRGFNVPNGPQPFALVVDGAASLTVPPPPALPNAPSGLTATAISNSRIDLAWTDNASNEDGFKIERCKGATCTNFAQIATVGPNVTSFSNTGLAKNTSYRYRVLAYNTAGNSGYSNIATAKTPR